MPTSGTHITIVQRLALNPLLSPFLGNPDTDPAVTDRNSPKYDPDGYIRMKFACLGAVGPDIFYAMADYGDDLQGYENFLIKVGGSFECMYEIMEETTRYIKGEVSNITQGVSDALLKTNTLLTGVINDSLLAFIVKAGFNFWPNFAPMRQKDRPLHEWYWADFLHYVRSGKFVHELLTHTKQNLDSDPHNTQYQNLYAYALGYLTHYIVDVVGHPYVNQVVQAPWRLYWQRHHLVENFIDAYVWDRWHTQLPPFPPPDPREQPLDRVTSTANTMGAGAPFTFARLHDFIAIGTPSHDDPIYALVEAVCEKIKRGLFDLGIAEKTDVPEPVDADFKEWTKLMADALKSVYADPPHPTRLEKPFIKGLPGKPRPGGYPFPEDIAAAYGAMRLVLKLTTEETITEPQPPDIVGDISADVTKLFTDLQTNLSNLPQPPQPSLSGNTLSLDDLWKAIKNTVLWLAEVAEQVVKTVFDFISDSIANAGPFVTESIKFALYLLNKALFALYRSVRLVIVLAADAAPFTQDLALNVGGSFNTRSLWCSPGDLGLDRYPLEEFTLNIGGKLIAPQLEFAHNPFAPYPPYAPFISPTALGAGVEQPPVNLTAPYRPAQGATFTTPDAFIDAPRGPDDMFTPGGPQPKAHTADPRASNTFAADPRNFGGAIANCEWALLHWSDPGFALPDYNLDGDRGYAWPCWDLETPVDKKAPKDPTDPDYDAKIPDPLNPTDDRNAGIAHVNAVPIQ